MPALKRCFTEREPAGENYRVPGVAGAGGMGVVYRALDVRLNRTVALKFLPAELNDSVRERERFLREARTACSLDHPNIGVIHSIEETADGQVFIVMAYYEGPSLAQRVAQGPLPPREAVEIAAQMANGLAEAHAHGIVHPDVKPSNVMLTGAGMAKIVDFALAMVVSSRLSTQTSPGGTFAYMSPEQISGRLVDPRCDMWALGAVLVEMLTGASPFRRDSVPAICLAILNDVPARVDTIPEPLQPVAYRTLAKDPERRFASCSEFLAALEHAGQQLRADDPALTLTQPPGRQRRSMSVETRRAREGATQSTFAIQPARRRILPAMLISLASLLVIAAGVTWFVPALRQRAALLLGVTPPEKHIAVLPFDNIGTNPENVALADGLMDSLAGRLSNLDVGNQSLWVIPVSEVRRRHITDPDQAMKELGASLVVTGSMERDGSDIRLTVNLIQTRNLRLMGSAEVEDPAGNLAMLEDEAVARLAQLMSLNVTANMLRDTGGHVDPAAYEGYLTALGNIERYDKPGNLALAIRQLQHSVQTDPNFALGYAALGEAYRLKFQVDKNTAWLDEAEADCNEAIGLDNSIPAVYVTLGQIHNAQGHRNLALDEFQQALSLDPRNVGALTGLARTYETDGKIAEAEATYRKAIDLEPQNWDTYNSLGNFLVAHGRYAEAVGEFELALQLTPDNAGVLLNLAGAYINLGDAASLAKAEPLLKKSIAISPSYAAWTSLGALHAGEQRYKEAAAATRKALAIYPSDYLVWDNLRQECEWQNDASCARQAAAGEMARLTPYLKTHPRDADADATYADVAAHYGPRDQVEQHIRTALAPEPQDPGILDAAADCWDTLGRHKLAVQTLNEAFAKGFTLRLALTDPEARSLLKDPGVHLPRQ